MPDSIVPQHTKSRDINRLRNRTCIDCGLPIIDRATRCRKCSARQRKHFTLNCTYCGNSFRHQRSAINKSGMYYCSRQCQREHSRLLRQRKCPICGTLFIPDHVNRSTSNYCSRHCVFISRRKKRVSFRCLTCGKEILKLSCLVRNAERVFCNMDCKIAWWRGSNHSSYNSHECICATCGKLFLRTKSRIKDGKKTYCSSRCFGQSEALPSIDYYGPNWREQRRKTRKRDQYECQICGRSEEELNERLSVHHRIPFRRFGLINYLIANQLGNLISLCRGCHRRVEKGKIQLTTSVSGCVPKS